MTRLVVPRPDPSHTGHGSSTTRPRPLQSLQGSAIPNPPESVLVNPVPTHVGHTRGTVPARAPVPPHDAHAAELVSFSGIVLPSTASMKLTETSRSTSAPRRAAPDRLRARWLNSPPKTSPMPPPAPPPENRSPRSNENEPPLDPPPGVRTPLLNSARASSYSLRFCGSDRTE